jgi:mannonate dehydratase
LSNLAAEGINVVIYNFMPVLDWVRTDVNYVLPDGSKCLRYDPVRFAAFEIYALKRPGAQDDYPPDQLIRAADWWKQLDETAQDSYIRSIIDVFPGVKMGLSLDDIRAMLARYQHVSAEKLTENLSRFLQAVIPAAEKVGVRMAIHPDDPPFSLLGLPRIVSKASDLRTLLKLVDSPANGLCFCTGSLGARTDNPLLAMIGEFAARINAVHLRSTQMLADGSFYEADHLAGSVDMPAVVGALLDVQDQRRKQGRADWQLSFRPDHGHLMMDDLVNPADITPGYSCIGRMRGLAELRGLMLGLRHAQRSSQ